MRDTIHALGEILQPVPGAHGVWCNGTRGRTGRGVYVEERPPYYPAEQRYHGEVYVGDALVADADAASLDELRRKLHAGVARWATGSAAGEAA